MTREAFPGPADPAPTPAPPAAGNVPLPDLPVPDLPLVSVVIVNFNYGRFLRAAVDSVFAQTYPRVECIVVDNASTDESPAVLGALAGVHPGLRILRRPANDGQTPAALDGLAATRGAYVIFVDADDILLPTGVEAHVFAHLSLRLNVGFTSGDMLQLAGDEIVVATSEEFNRYIRGGKGRRPQEVRPFRALSAGGWPAPAVADRLQQAIHVVPPLHTGWVWAPTSGSCYRRDALLKFADNPDLAQLRTGTDMYFAHAIGALNGSALIDEPVFAYRIHGDNIYSRHPQLERTLAYRPGSAGDSNNRARLFIIDHLVRNAARFAPNLLLKLNLVALLLRLDVGDPTPGLPAARRRSRLRGALARDGGPLRATLGPWLFGVVNLVSWLPYPRI